MGTTSHRSQRHRRSWVKDSIKKTKKCLIPEYKRILNIYKSLDSAIPKWSKEDLEHSNLR